MKLIPVAVFGELAQIGLQLIKILHGGYYLLGDTWVVSVSFLDTYPLQSVVLSALSVELYP